MKVGISYAVDLSEIPEELEKLIKEVRWDLAEKLDELSNNVSSGDFVSAFKNIKNMRHNLQRTDTRLEDCNTIISGYLTVLKRISDEAEAEEERKASLGLGVRGSHPGVSIDHLAEDE